MPRWLKVVLVVATLAGPVLAAGPLLAFPIVQAFDWQLGRLIAPWVAASLAVGLVLSFGPGLAVMLVQRSRAQIPQPLRVTPEHGLDLRAPLGRRILG